MKLISLDCTFCGAKLQVDSEQNKCICQYCGHELLLDHEVQQHEHRMTNGFDFGYQQEMGRQRALAENQQVIMQQQIQQQAAMQQAAAQQQQEMINEHYRLINTPTAIKPLFAMRKQMGRPISEYEMDMLMRQRLATNKKLREEYEKGITAPPWMMQGKKSADDNALVLGIVGTLTCIIPTCGLLFGGTGLVCAILALCGYRRLSIAKSIIGLILGLIGTVVGVLVLLAMGGAI